MSLSQLIIKWISIYDIKGHILTNSLDKNHIIQNIEALNKKLTKKDFNNINAFFKAKVKKIDIKKIKVIDWDIDKSHKIYTSLREAIKNRYNLKPSIEYLVEEIKMNGFKPIELRKGKDFYYVMQGRMRFWAYKYLYKQKNNTFNNIILDEIWKIFQEQKNFNHRWFRHDWFEFNQEI